MNHLSRLLLDERPLIVLPNLAEKIGLNEAIILQQLHYKALADSAEVQDGRRWVRTTVDALGLEFPFWSKSTIERALKALKDDGYIETKRSRDANLYTVDTTRTRQLDGSAPSAWPPQGLQIDGLSSKEEGKEEQETLFAGKPAEEDPTDQIVSDVWAVYLAQFEDKLRIKDVTPARRRMILKAYKAVGENVDILKSAILGLKSWRVSHPDGSQDVALSVIFETGPHSGRNLTDQISWWADQAGGGGRGSVLDQIPAIHRALVAEKMQVANRLIQGRATDGQRQDSNDAIAWLARNFNLIGERREDGSVKWEKIP